MKLLLLLGSFLIGNIQSLFKNPREALTQQIILKIRALTALLLTSVGALALFCCGFYMFLSHVATQLDNSGAVQWTATLVISASLSLASLWVLIFSLRSKAWLKATGLQASSAKSSGKQTSPLENAVALLIVDFIKEREQRRGHDKEAS